MIELVTTKYRKLKGKKDGGGEYTHDPSNPCICIHDSADF